MIGESSPDLVSMSLKWQIGKIMVNRGHLHSYGKCNVPSCARSGFGLGGLVF